VGDTLAAMEGYKLEAVAAFEPDQENFQALKIWVEQAVGLPKETVLFPCGLGSQTGWQSFHSSQQAGSAMGEAGETAIQVLALDDVLPRFEPTFIKLDIEGAETAALNGAAQTITSSQPRLAICVYHRPDDLWNVPLLMRQLVPGHRLFLRYHGFNGFDAVAYAIEP
jgi:FkbM family methyltransferase